LTSTLTFCNIPTGFPGLLAWITREGWRVRAHVGGRSILVSLQRLAVTLVLVIVTVLGLMCAVSFDRAHAIGSKPIRWLFAGPGVVAAIAADAEASHFLDDTRPFVMGGMRGRKVPGVPPGWNTIPLTSLKSFGAIRNALQMGGLGPEVRGVMYDYENWPFTPEEEQRNPAGYVKQAADLVHAHGLLFLTAPAIDLVTVMAPGNRGRQDDLYIKLGIAADAARYADVVDIQAQRFERTTELYANFVRQAAAQARQANPKVMVLAGLSTQPGGQQVTADDILRAIAATRDIVDGYWFNIPKQSEYCPRCTEFRPDIAIEVLHRLAGQ
jgi:hypothetical protein